MKAQYELGALVVDTVKQRLGRVMGCYGPYLQLRPPGGGLEWDARPESVRVAREDEIVQVRAEEAARGWPS